LPIHAGEDYTRAMSETSHVALVLSTVSSSVRWVAYDSLSGHLLGERSWNDDQSRALSDSLGRELALLPVELSRVGKVLVLTGPGAFTGLRMGVAFAMGLARGLGVPLVAIPTWDLFGRPFFIPTRHQMAKKLSLSACLQESLEFMHVTSPTESTLAKPSPGDLVLGTAESPEWPSVKDLLQAALHSKTHQHDSEIKIFYGLEPTISGERKTR
jgi:hypothetical protein